MAWSNRVLFYNYTYSRLTRWGRRWPTNWMRRKDRSRSFSRHYRYEFFCFRTSPFRQYIRQIRRLFTPLAISTIFRIASWLTDVKWSAQIRNKSFMIHFIGYWPRLPYRITKQNTWDWIRIHQAFCWIRFRIQVVSGCRSRMSPDPDQGCCWTRIQLVFLNPTKNIQAPGINSHLRNKKTLESCSYLLSFFGDNFFLNGSAHLNPGPVWIRNTAKHFWQCTGRGMTISNFISLA